MSKRLNFGKLNKEVKWRDKRFRIRTTEDIKTSINLPMRQSAHISEEQHMRNQLKASQLSEATSKSAKARKPSMPKMPWDDKSDIRNG